jgi:hypothetical protein
MFIDIATEDKSYSNTMLAEIDLSATPVPTCTIAMPTALLQFGDIRLNAFTGPDASSVPTDYLEICDRSGQPGVPGAGTHFVTTVPAPASLPPEATDLSVISNPYQTVMYEGYLYINDYDSNGIFAVNVPAFALADQAPAYEFVLYPNRTCSGVAMLVEGGCLYAVFNVSTNYVAPYEGSYVVRLSQTGPNGRLYADGNADYLQIGSNCVSAAKVHYKLAGNGNRTRAYVMAACVGGDQGTGNGQLSQLSVVDLTGWAVLASPLAGTFNSLDMKGVCSTPTVDNEAYVWIMAASYTSSYSGTNFVLAQSRLSRLIENAARGVTEDLASPAYYPRILDSNAGPWAGYFWGLAFVPSGYGLTGNLIAGLGSPPQSNGDRIRIYPVTATGADPLVYTEFGSADLYNAQTCVINTMAVTTDAGTTHVRSALGHVMSVLGVSSKAGFSPPAPAEPE